MPYAPLAGAAPSADPDHVAVLRGVHYAVDQKAVFRGLDIAIARGRVTAIMGRAAPARRPSCA